MKITPPARPVGRRLNIITNKYDALGISIPLFGGLFLLWYEICHILPTYYPEATVSSGDEKVQLELMCHYAVAIFLSLNIYGNMYKVVITNTSKDRFMFISSTLLPDGWRYCSECDLNLPPRSHHCKLCDTCILKRDHHCLFTGCCVGYFNHRYYLVMVTHMLIAAIYCNIFNLSFVVSVKGPLTLYTFLSYVGPHMGWLLGYYDTYVFCITLLTTVGVVVLGLLSWLLYIQLNQIIFGQTCFEKKKNIRKYNCGLFHNFKEVLGIRWYLVFLFPWIPSPLVGSGTEFKVKGD